RLPQVGDRRVQLPLFQAKLGLQFQPINITIILAQNASNERLGRIEILAAKLDFRQCDLRRNRVIAHARVVDELLEQLNAVVGVPLREVEFGQRELILENVCASLDAGQQLLARCRRSFDLLQESHDVEAGLDIGGICGGEHAQFLFRIVRALLIQIKPNQLYSKCAFLRIQLRELPKQGLDLAWIFRFLKQRKLEELDPDVLIVSGRLAVEYQQRALDIAVCSTFGSKNNQGSSMSGFNRKRRFGITFRASKVLEPHKHSSPQRKRARITAIEFD